MKSLVHGLATVLVVVVTVFCVLVQIADLDRAVDRVGGGAEPGGLGLVANVSR